MCLRFLKLKNGDLVLSHFPVNDALALLYMGVSEQSRKRKTARRLITFKTHFKTHFVHKNSFWLWRQDIIRMSQRKES